MASEATIDIGTLIESRRDLHGGRPCIAGTGMTVQAIARRYQQGNSAEQSARDIPDIPLSHIHAAVAYYLANRAGIDGELVEHQAEADRLFEEWKRERSTSAGQ